MDKKNKPVIGKFVIENLTVGMYDDARCIFREYVQNSADAIDKAIEVNIVSKENASIYIQIKEENNFIEFEDNGTGIPQTLVPSLLQDVAQSEKQIGKEKGFRGIGRLGGLAYCEKLIFETSYKGESTKSIMIWDAKRLKEIVGNRSKKEEASEVISSVTTFESESENAEKHYFKVKMLGVTNADLLDKSDIKDYLKMVAPVPFDSHFIFRKKIYDELQRESLNIDEYNIFVNEEQIYKGYTTQLYSENGGKRTTIGEIRDIQFFKNYDNAGNLLYWGWHSISNVQNLQLKSVNRSRGLRLRKENIQIGDENRLRRLFKDGRFNFYVVGEVYAFHENLIPNGRRDDFEDSKTFTDFKNKLKSVCNEIQKISYASSDISNAKKDIDDLQKFKEVVEEKQKTGIINREEQQKLEAQLEQKKDKAEKAEKKLIRFKETIESQEETPLTKIFRDVVKDEIPKVDEIKVSIESAKPVFRTDKLSRLNKAERKLLSSVFGIIKNVLSEDLAENLIRKIEEEFK
jgi:molecular chaperone HtpG